ncbi:unnamed protein product, partial [Staurois parvus]
MGPPGNRRSMGRLSPWPHSKHTQKKPIKGTRRIYIGPLLTPGPWPVPECSNGLSAP